MSAVTVKVIKLEDHFKAVMAQCGVDTVNKAALAGGHVVEAYAKINANQVFSGKSVGGAGLVGSIQTVLAGPAEVDVGPTVIYGRIQELGGTVKTVRAKWLTFQTDDGTWHRVKVVHMPARPYLRPAVDEHIQEVVDAIGFQLKKAISSACGGP